MTTSWATCEYKIKQILFDSTFHTLSQIKLVLAGLGSNLASNHKITICHDTLGGGSQQPFHQMSHGGGGSKID
jgi:hypothetical protein